MKGRATPLQPPTTFPQNTQISRDSRERLARSWAFPHVEKFYTVAWEPFCPKIADLVFFLKKKWNISYLKYVLRNV